MFLEWLHTRSHEPLACLTARSATILLHGTDGKKKQFESLSKIQYNNDFKQYQHLSLFVSVSQPN